MNFRRGAAWALFIAAMAGWVILAWGILREQWQLGSLSGTFFLPGLGSSIVGLLLTLKRPRHRIGWLLAWIGLLAAAFHVVEQINLHIEPDGFGVSLLLEFAQIAIFFSLIGGLLVLFPLWFPTGKIPGRRWAWVFPAYFLTSSLLILLELVFPDPDSEAPLLAAIWLLVGPVASLASLIFRYRGSSTEVRHQIRWVIFAMLLLLGSFAADLGLVTVPAAIISVWIIMAATFFYFAIGLAILKYRLYDIDRIISRTAAYALVIGLLAAVFVISVTLTQQLLPIESQFGIVVSTLVVAALFNPLRVRVQNAVDQRFNRSRYDAQRVVDEFSSRLQDDVDLDLMQAALLSAAQETMQPSYISLWVKDRANESRIPG